MKYGEPTPHAIRVQRAQGSTDAEICKQFGITNKQLTRLIPETTDIQPLGERLELGGNWIVAMDVHEPFCNPNLSELLVAVAEAQNITNLVVVGDFFNMDAYSTFENIAPPVTFKQELTAARLRVKQWREWFTRIVIVPGNHDYRWWKRHEGQMDGEELFSLVDSTGKVEWTKFSHCWVNSCGVKYLLTHPRNYSRSALVTANKLAQKYQCNVISAHEHHLGKTMDEFDRYVCINGGCLADEERMAYTQLINNTMPRFQKGFVILKDGVGHEVSRFPYTDWSMWGV